MGSDSPLPIERCFQDRRLGLAGVKGESVGWPGCKEKMGLDTLRYSTRVEAGENRPAWLDLLNFMKMDLVLQDKCQALTLQPGCARG